MAIKIIFVSLLISLLCFTTLGTIIYFERKKENRKKKLLQQTLDKLPFRGDKFQGFKVSQLYLFIEFCHASYLDKLLTKQEYDWRIAWISHLIEQRIGTPLDDITINATA